MDRIKLYLSAGALIVLMTVLTMWRWSERRDAARRQHEQALEQDIAVLHQRSDSLFLRTMHDTTVLFRRVTHHDTTIQQLIDTAIVHHTDTVRITVRELAAIDTTLRSCRITATTCAEGFTVARREADSLKVEVKLLKKDRPSFLSRCGVSAGYGFLVSGAAGPGVVAGCRFFP